jgi:CubicO group peptidase (beta-lactamase class C family)
MNGNGSHNRKLESLIEAVRGHVERGELPSAQFALARHGALITQQTFGAPDDSLYVAFSTTKAVVGSAVWLLIQDGHVEPQTRVQSVVSELSAPGMEAVTVEHLLTHTAGFPRAPFEPLHWSDRATRLARFEGWTLDWSPGTRYEYHAASAMWLLAEMIERCSGMDFRIFIRERIADPLELPDLHVGLADGLNGRVVETEQLGEAPDPELLAQLGIKPAGDQFAEEAYLERFNEPTVRALGVPGVGGVMSAGSLAMFYQALLEGGCGVWSPETIEMALEVRTGALRDPMTGRSANRSLGLVIAGDDDRMFRAFAPTNSPSAFGHAGAGGQLSWADPASGLSFVFFTNGLDRDPIRMGMRGMSLSSLATECAV